QGPGPPGPGGPGRPGAPQGPNPPPPQGQQGHQNGQFPAASPHQTGPVAQVPPNQEQSQSQNARPHAQPYVPPASLPPHRPMQPGKRRRWVAITAVAAIVLVVLLFTTLTLLGMQNLIWQGAEDSGGDQAGSGGDGAQAAPGDPDEDEQSGATSAPNIASDGRMVFRVQEYECSPDIDGRSTVNRGTYCVFALSVQNTGPERVSLEHDRQRLAKGGQEFLSASEPSVTESQAPLWRSIPSGEQAEGQLVFIVLDENDVDTGSLHLSSGGGSPAVVEVADVTKAG
ncbi:hypothetical protein ACFQZ2_21875, partial [Streptomonospora algeriensis]